MGAWWVTLKSPDLFYHVFTGGQSLVAQNRVPGAACTCEECCGAGENCVNGQAICPFGNPPCKVTRAGQCVTVPSGGSCRSENSCPSGETCINGLRRCATTTRLGYNLRCITTQPGTCVAAAATTTAGPTTTTTTTTTTAPFIDSGFG